MAGVTSVMGLRAMLQPAILPAYATSAARIVRRRVRGHRRFPGDARAICGAIVDSCWTGEYFAASGGHFRQFWTRDLGFSAPSLVRLGHRERLRASLDWALDAWARHGGRVTTTIFPGRRPADVYTFGIDSLPFLLRSLEAAGADEWGPSRPLAGRRGRRYADTVLDRRTGLVRDDRRFSTHRDTVVTASNAYANTMVALLDAVLRRTDWFPTPIPPSPTDRLIEAFWRGRPLRPTGATAMCSPVTRMSSRSGSAWCATRAGLAAAVRAMDSAGLATPLPLRYAARRDRSAEDPIQRLFVPDYQGTAIWTSLGAMYVDARGASGSRCGRSLARRLCRARGARGNALGGAHRRPETRIVAGSACSLPTKRCSGRRSC